ncbi:MAG: hypothetical protein N3E45_16370 [Oscillatoriaceae bacterium SKW80]|nr:hypothetical protein [Oscillatoriaceae bacterium SKYG93]MCX8122374.1 hypothetical protein [Oscillatoriaceae bacterium SKW80]MDW8452482.1 hypothetical protein [Oscillatoriaceae cyanobacterium SKYGB_i_bin93]
MTTRIKVGDSARGGLLPYCYFKLRMNRATVAIAWFSFYGSFRGA